MKREHLTISGINNYDFQLTDSEIQQLKHRGLVGGFWEALGKLQLAFLIEQGLQSQDTVLDVGCGCLRGGIPLISYLEKSNYKGMDVNASLLKAGQHEIKLANLEDKKPHLVLDDAFEFEKFNLLFDCMMAVSLFTHLPTNIILRCLVNAKRSLKNEGAFYATFFIVGGPEQLTPHKHSLGGITTHYDKDPYHYSEDHITMMASLADLDCHIIGEWGHPRNQKMVKFTPKKVPAH